MTKHEIHAPWGRIERTFMSVWENITLSCNWLLTFPAGALRASSFGPLVSQGAPQREVAKLEERLAAQLQYLRTKSAMAGSRKA